MKQMHVAWRVTIGFALVLLVWQAIVSLGGHADALLPSPWSVGQALMTLIQNGVLWTHIQVSLVRFVIGYMAGAVVAIPLGLLLGRLPRIWGIFDPVVQVIRPISPIAWSPFIVLWFGIGNAPAIVIIFLAVFFPVLLSTVTGIRRMDPLYWKVAQNYEMSGWSLVSKLMLPAVFPSIASGLHLAIGSGWIFLVSGEMVGAQSGLGYLIVDARNQMRMDLVSAGIVCIGLCGFALDRLIRLLEQRVNKQWGIEQKVSPFVTFRLPRRPAARQAARSADNSAAAPLRDYS